MVFMRVSIRRSWFSRRDSIACRRSRPLAGSGLECGFSGCSEKSSRIVHDLALGFIKHAFCARMSLQEPRGSLLDEWKYVK